MNSVQIPQNLNYFMNFMIVLTYQFHIVFGVCRANLEPKGDLQKSVCLFNLKIPYLKEILILKIISMIWDDF